MKSALRSIKNEWNDYNDGERLAREVTSSAELPPTVGQLQQLVKYVNTYSLQEFKKIFVILMKRVTDYRYLKHMEKGLLVMEYLMRNGSQRFVRSCRINKKHFEKLKKFKYVLEGRDYGENVRRRTTRICAHLEDELKMETARKKAQGPEYKMQLSKAKKSRPKIKPPKAKSKSKPSSPGVDTSKSLKPSSAKKSRKKKKKPAEETKSPEPVESDFLSDLFGADVMATSSASDAAVVATTSVYTPVEEVDDDTFFSELAFAAADIGWDDPFAADGSGDGVGDGAVINFDAVVDDGFSDDWDFGGGTAVPAEDDTKDPESFDEDHVSLWRSALTDLSAPTDKSKAKATKKTAGVSLRQMEQRTDGALPSGYDDSYLSSMMGGGTATVAPVVGGRPPVAAAAVGYMGAAPVVTGGAYPGHYGAAAGGAPVVVAAAPDPFAAMFGGAGEPQVSAGPVPATYKKGSEKVDLFADFSMF